MRFIPLTNSRFSAIVDDDDYDRVMALNTNWQVVYKNNKPTAIRSTSFYGRTSLHRFILKQIESDKSHVDHIYHDIFDNRKDFIRVCSRSQNAINRFLTRNKKYKGVVCRYDNYEFPFVARIMKKGIRHTIGHFKTEEEAARAYDKKAQELFGNFAFLNFKSQ